MVFENPAVFGQLGSGQRFQGIEAMEQEDVSTSTPSSSLKAVEDTAGSSLGWEKEL